MSADNFTGQFISSTFQRLLQLSDNGNGITDGTGSIVNFLPINVNNALTASYVPGVTATTPGGGQWAIQFNSASTFQGSANLTFNSNTSFLNLTGSVIISGSIYNTNSIYFSGSNAASRLVWNNTDGTLDLEIGRAHV